MDNLTHSLCGAALAKTRLRKLSPYSLPVSIAAANLPDLDILTRVWGGPDAYLVDHRGLTHALLGVFALSLALAALVRACERRWRPEFHSSFARAWLAAAIPLATHPLLDFLNSYGWRPFLPFDAGWRYGDLLFIVDPWVWLAFGAAVALAGERSRVGSIALGATAIGAAVVLCAAGAPLAVCAGWIVAAVLLAILRARGAGRMHPDGVVLAIAALFALYLGALALANRRARDLGLELARQELGSETPIERVAATPRELDPRAWTVYVETPREIWVRDLELGSPPGAALRLDRCVDDPFVERALASECSAAFRSFARFAFARVIERDDGCDVHLMDARYQREPGHDAFRPSTAGERPRATWCSVCVRFDRDNRWIGCDR